MVVRVSPPVSQSVPARVVAKFSMLGLLLPAELLSLSIRYDALSLYDRSTTVWFQWLGQSGNVAKIAVVFVFAVLLALGPRLRRHCGELINLAPDHAFVANLLAHAGTYIVFLLTTDQIFGDPGAELGTLTLLPILWMSLVPLLLVTWLRTIAPLAHWWRLAVEERGALGTAALVAICAWFIAIYARQLWSPLTEFTFVVASSLLQLAYTDVIVNTELAILGTADFKVRIAAECAGYEGIGLMIVFTAFFLSVFRRDFKFPQALLLFPIGVVTIWIFNAIRIVALIMIGSEISPDIALGGFHSQAGWISFILVAVGSSVFAYRLPFFSRVERAQRKTSATNLPVALLTPLVVLIASTLLTSALSADIDWLYPLRVVATAIVLVGLWQFYDFLPYRPSPVAIGAGFGVFALWLALVPEDVERSAVVASELQGATTFAVVLWMTFRTIGSAITVPLAEELAFRGYLLGRLSRGYGFNGRLRFSWVPWIVSSLLFGLLHGAWIAGILAGMVYGLVRYHRDKISDAVVAHAVTNLLLSAYVMTTGSWSLW